MKNNDANMDVCSQECERSHETWVGFTKLLKYSTISIIVLLILMSWFLL